MKHSNIKSVAKILNYYNILILDINVIFLVVADVLNVCAEGWL